MEFLKKQSISTWISLGTCILALAAVIIYGVNVAGGYFQDVTSAPVVVFGILSILALIAIIILAQFEFEGIIGKVVAILADVLKIVVPMFLMICVLSFVSSRIEGLAYIFGSNEEILATIQTPGNLSSAYGAIAGFIMFGIASVAAMVGAFFRTTKKA